MLPFILHHANRSTKDAAFYRIKDVILKKYGTTVDHDVQHIPGKKCYSCGGTGLHARYSNTYPYKPYDYDACWHCIGGWYRMPQWVCLARIKYGKYIFHRPLLKELRVKNPFTLENMGYEVSSNKVIEGYIDHKESKIGPECILILYWLYDRDAFKIAMKQYKSELRWSIIRLKRSLKKFFTLKSMVIRWPGRVYFYDHSNEDLPF